MYWCLQINPLPNLTEMKFEFVSPVASELIPEHTSSDLKAVTPLLANVPIRKKMVTRVIEKIFLVVLACKK